MTAGSVCRACLKSLIVESEDLRLFVDMDAYVFTYCTSLQLSEDDALTKSICRGCHDLLNSFYAFKQLCISSNETLLERLDSKAKLRRTADVRLPVEPKEEDVKQEEVDLDDCAYDGDFQADDDSDEEWKPKVALSLKLLTENANKLEGEEIDPVTLETLKEKKRTGRPRKNKIAKSEPKKTRKKYGMRTHSCTLCGRKFALTHSLEEHMLTVHEGLNRKSINKCTICNRNFSTSYLLAKHKKRIHCVDVELLTCECGEVLDSLNALRSHRRMHQRERQQICPVCGKSVPLRSFSVHVKYHTNKYKYKEKLVDIQCDKCGKKFTKRSILNQHMAVHSAKTVPCGVCGNLFFSKGAVRKHSVMHMEVKPHRCDVCGKRYSSKTFLRHHKYTHTGERPFKCDMCDMTFTSKHRMEEHRRVHTGDRRYVCPVCGHAFVQCGTYKRHVRTVHPDDYAAIHKVGLLRADKPKS